jgi:S1-C subfamily serine protease
MKRILIAMMTLMMLAAAPMGFAQSEEAEANQAEEAAAREALREELEQARRDVAKAAREMARLQRELADSEVEIKRFEIRKEMESMKGDLAEMERHIHREVGQGLRMTRPRLGVLLGGEGDANEVVGVTPGSGAEKAGIETGDRLVSINGQAVDASDPASLRAPMEGVEAGDSVPVEIEREGERMAFDVTVSSPARDLRVITHDIKGPPIPPDAPVAPDAPHVEREVIVLNGERAWIPEPPMPPLPPRLAGLGRHSDLVSNHAGLEPYFGTGEGVLVLRIDPDNLLGLQDGDVVMRVGGEAVSRPVDIGRALLGQGGRTVTLEVMRGGEAVTIDAELPEGKAVSALMRELHPNP